MDRFPTDLEIEEGRWGFLDPTRVLIALRNEQSLERIAEIVREFGLIPEAAIGERPVLGPAINHTPTRFWFRSEGRDPIDSRRLSAIEAAIGEGLDWSGPVYGVTDERGQTDFLCALPHVILTLARDRDAIARVRDRGFSLNEARSKFLGGHVLMEIVNRGDETSFDVVRNLELRPPVIGWELMPMIRNLCAVPNDTLFAQQWNMTRIAGPQAWDIGTGTAGTVIAVIDTGVDLTHPDLRLAGSGIDLGDMMGDGSPNNSFGADSGHGTCCAGIAAGVINDMSGVAGVAGGCSILPLAISTFSNVEIAAGLNWAVAQGAAVISMSISIPQSGIVDTELAGAAAANVVLCAATANADALGVAYPARHPLVMAIGASDQNDNRKSPTSPDGEWWWGSNFGPEVSVVAPGVLIPTTDIQDIGGYSTVAGTAGDHFLTFNGTSSATPHVAGLAGLMRSQYPMLSAAAVRAIIERTAEKVGTVPYAEAPGYPNGTWNNEMGYGRINAHRALDVADVMIRDWPGDTGAEPSTAGNFWDFSDIAVRITDDNVFNPGNAGQSKHVERGQTNYIYVRITNLGPRDARNVAVNLRITPYVGLQFVHPQDWTLTDATHVAPTSITGGFSSVAAGSSVIAKFSISANQVESLYGWQTGNPWHPCLLAQVTADNDYAFGSSDLTFGNLVVRKNNFAQRNLTVVDVLASSLMAFPFVVGSRFRDARQLWLEINRSQLPEGARVELRLGGNEPMFPLVNFSPPRADDSGGPGQNPGNRRIVFEERTQLLTRLGDCEARFTLEKNSTLELVCHPLPVPKIRDLRGGTHRTVDGRDVVVLTEPTAQLVLEIEPHAIHALSLTIAFPGPLRPGEVYSVVVAQSDGAGNRLGGATALYRLPG